MSEVVEQVKAQLKQIEDLFSQHLRLVAELERLRDAILDLEHMLVSYLSGGSSPAAEPTGHATPSAGAERATATARTPRGHNKAKILHALRGHIDPPRCHSAAPRARRTAALRPGGRKEQYLSPPYGLGLRIARDAAGDGGRMGGGIARLKSTGVPTSTPRYTGRSRRATAQALPDEQRPQPPGGASQCPGVRTATTGA